ncbi:MAG: hypothetical protein D6680_04870 [Cyanobacteria bacterium J007]|jgi:photosystem II stability/assembly factor-like uncharacterized protein|nr:MAG: hypothetical protein D6680_04870 [Cyanobacteria bacterium J007]
MNHSCFFRIARSTAIALFAGTLTLGCSPRPELQTFYPAPMPSPSVPATPTRSPAELPALTRAPNWQQDNHVHALGVDPDNPEVLYIATHYGLVRRSEDGQWYWVGDDRSDYMGFAVDPGDRDRFYMSGHPPTGGNLGFRVTENRGKDWKTESMSGVDFHAIAVAPADPKTIYGWATSGEVGFFVSRDRGQTWTELRPIGLEEMPFNLIVDPARPDRVFATTRAGLYQSNNSGRNWALVPNTDTAPIVGLAVLEDGTESTLYGYRLLDSAPGLYRSNNGGQTWETFGEGIEGIVVHLVQAPGNSQILYAANQDNGIFQSRDRGATWTAIATP